MTDEIYNELRDVAARLRAAANRVGQDADGWCLVGREPMDGEGNICVFWCDGERIEAAI